MSPHPRLDDNHNLNPFAAALPVSRDPRPAPPFESQTKSPARNPNHFNPLRAVKIPIDKLVTTWYTPP
jgi:hypothetical protein